MSVKLKTASNGSVTLAPVDTASDVTLTVAAGSSSLVSNTTLRTELNATGSAPIYACRAWANFNGTGTVAIRASGNVSSITDNGTGDYTVNFTTAMPDVNYAVSGLTGTDASDLAIRLVGGGYLAGSTRILTQSLAGVAADRSVVTFFAFR